MGDDFFVGRFIAEMRDNGQGDGDGGDDQADDPFLVAFG